MNLKQLIQQLKEIEAELPNELAVDESAEIEVVATLEEQQRIEFGIESLSIRNIYASQPKVQIHIIR